MIHIPTIEFLEVFESNVKQSVTGVAPGKSLPWSEPPLIRMVIFVSRFLSKFRGGTKQNEWYQFVAYGLMCNPDLRPVCNLELDTMFFVLKNLYRHSHACKTIL